MTPPKPADEEDRSTPAPALTHAGGIVVRDTPKGLRYLLVRARKNPMEWLLPKGHIEPGETAEQAALREVREEAGVEAAIAAYVGATEFDFAGEHCRVGFYLMRFVREVAAAEERGVAWHNFESALVLTPFADVRTLLMRAHTMRSL